MTIIFHEHYQPVSLIGVASLNYNLHFYKTAQNETGLGINDLTPGEI